MNFSKFLKFLVDFSTDELNDILNHFEKTPVSKNEVLVPTK